MMTKKEIKEWYWENKNRLIVLLMNKKRGGDGCYLNYDQACDVYVNMLDYHLRCPDSFNPDMIITTVIQMRLKELRKKSPELVSIEDMDFVDTSHSSEVTRSFSKLIRKEIDIFCKGKSNCVSLLQQYYAKDIPIQSTAKELGVGKNTVSNFVEYMEDKYGEMGR